MEIIEFRIYSCEGEAVYSLPPSKSDWTSFYIIGDYDKDIKNNSSNKAGEE